MERVRKVPLSDPGELPPEVREELLTFVDRNCLDRGCDDTLRHTWTWAADRRIHPGRIARLLEALGRVRCDCELATRLGRFGEPPDETG